MQDEGQRSGLFAALRKRVGRAALALDAFVDSWMYESGRRWRDSYANFSAFMDRFYVSGFKWLGMELACEALTLGLVGLLVALTFAQLAFRETSDDWLKKQDLAITFLDRYGKEVGRRGILHDRGCILCSPDALEVTQWVMEDWAPDGTIRMVRQGEEPDLPDLR